VHRVEQPRHQRQPLPLAPLMVIKHVLFPHAAPQSPRLPSPLPGPPAAHAFFTRWPSQITAS
jgi:hypothetical protein